jgi:hypothetical protein
MSWMRLHTLHLHRWSQPPCNICEWEQAAAWGHGCHFSTMAARVVLAVFSRALSTPLTICASLYMCSISLNSIRTGTDALAGSTGRYTAYPQAT